MDENPALKKAVSTFLGIFTFLLLGFGFTVLGYLGYKVYKNPPQKIGDISGSLSNVPLASPPTASSLTQTQSSESAAVEVHFNSSGPDKDLDFILSQPKYGSLAKDIAQIPEKRDTNSYTYNKSLFDLVQKQYTQTNDPALLIFMEEIESHSETLPGFKNQDMPIPS